VPDRAIIPLLPALSIGFIAGIIAAALQLTSGAALVVGIAGGIVVAMAAVSTVFGVSGDKNEKTIVAALRAGCAVALYACMFLFIQGFLREGKASSLIWLALGVLLAIVLTQLRVRDRGELRTSSD
jgi:branched-subunit amino acid ABC-type transport system permease component